MTEARKRKSRPGFVVFRSCARRTDAGGQSASEGSPGAPSIHPPLLIHLAAPAPTPHLEEGVPICSAELEQGVEWNANDRGQSHEEANGHGPAWILVLVVGDWLVLDHGEDENELQRVGVGSGRESCPAPPGLRPPISTAPLRLQLPRLERGISGRAGLTSTFA